MGPKKCATNGPGWSFIRAGFKGLIASASIFRGGLVPNAEHRFSSQKVVPLTQILERYLSHTRTQRNKVVIFPPSHNVLPTPFRNENVTHQPKHFWLPTTKISLFIWLFWTNKDDAKETSGKGKAFKRKRCWLFWPKNSNWLFVNFIYLNEF